MRRARASKEHRRGVGTGMRALTNPRASGAPYAPEDAVIVSLDAARMALGEISPWPGYAPTPLLDLPDLAERPGIGRLAYRTNPVDWARGASRHWAAPTRQPASDRVRDRRRCQRRSRVGGADVGRGGSSARGGPGARPIGAGSRIQHRGRLTRLGRAEVRGEALHVDVRPADQHAHASPLQPRPQWPQERGCGHRTRRLHGQFHLVEQQTHRATDLAGKGKYDS